MMLTTMTLRSLAACLLLLYTPDALQLPSRKAFSQHAAAIVVGTAAAIGPAANAMDDSIFGPLETAIIDASDATYPVLKSLSADTVSPLASKLASLVNKKMDPAKLTTALETGADAVLGIEMDKVDKFTNRVKTAYEGVSGSDCTTIPLSPSAALSSLSVQGIDATKISAVKSKWSSSVQAIPKSSNGEFCLPASKEGLQQLWLGQTELVFNIPTAQKKAFATSTSAAVGSVPNPDLLRVLPDAKKVLKGVDPKTANKFQVSGKTLDAVLKADVRLKAVAQVK